jgi:gamma-glutamylcysteine synthetase
VTFEESEHQVPFAISRRSAEHMSFSFEEMRLRRPASLREACCEPPRHLGVPGLIVSPLRDEHWIARQYRAALAYCELI